MTAMVKLISEQNDGGGAAQPKFKITEALVVHKNAHDRRFARPDRRASGHKPGRRCSGSPAYSAATRAGARSGSSGSLIKRSVWKPFAPSICADSRISLGIFSSPARKRIMAKPELFQKLTRITETIGKSRTHSTGAMPTMPRRRLSVPNSPEASMFCQSSA